MNIFAKIQKTTRQNINRLHQVGLSALAVSVVAATDTFADAKSSINEGLQATGQSGGVTLENGIQNVINILLFLIGMVSVVMIIIGGIRYSTSNGDQGQIKQAKDTIMYAVIGLVVAIMAFAIVTFVVNHL